MACGIRTAFRCPYDRRHRPCVLVSTALLRETHGLEHDWLLVFWMTFQRHWPTDGDNTYVDFIRDGLFWIWCSTSRRQFSLAPPDRGTVQSKIRSFISMYKESVAKSTHSGLPWLRASFASNSEPAFIFGHSTSWTPPPEKVGHCGSLPCVMEPSIRERRSKPTPARRIRGRTLDAASRNTAGTLGNNFEPKLQPDGFGKSLPTPR